jgi:hypothetical protein
VCKINDANCRDIFVSNIHTSDLISSLEAEWNSLNLTLWDGLSSHQKYEILQVQELYILYVGGNAIREASLPDQIQFGLLLQDNGYYFINNINNGLPIDLSLSSYNQPLLLTHQKF